MSPRRTAPLDEARVVRDLEIIRDGAMGAEAWAPALRAVELLGRHIGMWRSDSGRPQTSLAELIAGVAPPAEPKDGSD